MNNNTTLTFTDEYNGLHVLSTIIPAQGHRASDYFQYMACISAAMYVMYIFAEYIELDATCFHVIARLIGSTTVGMAFGNFNLFDQAKTYQPHLQAGLDYCLRHAYLFDQLPLIYTLKQVPTLLHHGQHGIKQAQNHIMKHKLPYLALTATSMSHIMGFSVCRLDLGFIVASQMLLPMIDQHEQYLSWNIASSAIIVSLLFPKALDATFIVSLTWVATYALTYREWHRKALKDVWQNNGGAGGTQLERLVERLETFEANAKSKHVLPLIQITDLGDDAKPISHPMVEQTHSRHFYQLMLNVIKQRDIDYIKAYELDYVADSTNAWHLKKLQNLIHFIQKFNRHDRRYDSTQILHFIFGYLQSLYLNSPRKTVTYHAEDAKTIAGILEHLKLNTRTFDKADPAYNLTQTSGLQLTLGATDLLTAIFKNTPQNNKFGDALNKLSVDLNISLQMIDAYLINHDATINHLIYRSAYILLLYAIFVAMMGLCLSSGMVMPIISITLIASFVAIPVLTALFCFIAPNFIQHASFDKNLNQLDSLSETRGIIPSERHSELGHIMNYVAKTTVFYENLVIKTLYGIIFSTLLVSAIAIPIVFLSLHVLPSLAGIFTAIIIAVSIYKFLHRTPKPHKAATTELEHPNDRTVTEELAPESKTPSHIKIGENFVENSILSLAILLNPLLSKDQYDQSINELPSRFSVQTALFLSQFLLGIDHAISKAVVASIPLWHKLDQGMNLSETHEDLAHIWKTAKKTLNRHNSLSEDLSHILNELVTIHELNEHQPQNFIELTRMLIRFSLPHFPRLLTQSGIMSQLFKSMLTTCYPSIEPNEVEQYGKQIDHFLAANSNHEVAWLKSLAKSIKTFLDTNPSSEEPDLVYRRKWEEKIYRACQQIINEDHSKTLVDNPYVVLIQGILEIYQNGISLKPNISERDLQFRATLRYFSIMLEDVKCAEEEQYNFGDHYQYCWQQIPSIYFLIIVTISVLMLIMTPLSFSLPIVITALLGGLLLFPWLTQQTQQKMEAKGDQFGNLIDVSHKANEAVKKHDAGNLFISEFLTKSFNQLGQIFSTARGSLFNFTTVITLFGLLTIALLTVFFAHLNPITMAGMALVFLALSVACYLHERYYALPSFKQYEYKDPGQAPKAAKLFDSATPTTPLHHTASTSEKIERTSLHS